MKVISGKHRLMILMPNNTGNYLHSDLEMELNNAIMVRELLIDQEFTNQDVTLKEEGGYYRLILTVKDINGSEIVFHSRKLNLNDVVFEFDELTA